jgi:glycosyltransferase involved in cell wall biosynthesis
MASLNIGQLPTPPKDKKGWPWTEESAPVPERMPDGSLWPKVSVVTPSYNQGQFIEETIRSVLLQGYPNLEYIIIDGGSEDNSVEIIEKYSRWISFWVSETDQGQTNAINKGWRQATGKYITWLNSDDLLTPNSLKWSVMALENDPSIDIVYGFVNIIDENSGTYREPYNRIRPRLFDIEKMVLHWENPVPQQGFLMPRSNLEKCGYLDETFHFTMDFEYWMRLALGGGKGKGIDKVLGAFRHHKNTKTSSIQDRRIQDRYRIFKKIFDENHKNAKLKALKKRSRQNLAWDAAYISYKSQDPQRVRRYLKEYYNLAGLSSLYRVLPLYVVSLGGSYSLKMLRKGFRIWRITWNTIQQRSK